MKITKMNDELKKTVIARIDSQPSNLRLSVGSYGSITKDEAIKHVKNEDEIGKQIVNMHANFLKALSSGEFIKTINSVDS